MMEHTSDPFDRFFFLVPLIVCSGSFSWTCCESLEGYFQVCTDPR